MYEIKKSPVHGFGIFSTEFIPEGTVISFCPSLPSAGKEYPDYLFNSRVHGTVMLLGDGAIFNHSSEPSVDYREASPEHFEFTTLRNIEPGEEMFVDYGGGYDYSHFEKNKNKKYSMSSKKLSKLEIKDILHQLDKIPGSNDIVGINDDEKEVKNKYFPSEVGDFNSSNVWPAIIKSNLSREYSKAQIWACAGTSVDHLTDEDVEGINELLENLESPKVKPNKGKNNKQYSMKLKNTDGTEVKFYSKRNFSEDKRFILDIISDYNEVGLRVKNEDLEEIKNYFKLDKDVSTSSTIRLTNPSEDARAVINSRYNTHEGTFYLNISYSLFKKFIKDFKASYLNEELEYNLNKSWDELIRLTDENLIKAINICKKK